MLECDTSFQLIPPAYPSELGQNNFSSLLIRREALVDTCRIPYNRFTLRLLNVQAHIISMVLTVFEINGCPVVLTPKKVGGQPHFRLMVVYGHPCIYVFDQVLNWLTPKKNGGQPEIVTWLSIGRLPHFPYF